jgi:hypothetical protein
MVIKSTSPTDAKFTTSPKEYLGGTHAARSALGPSRAGGCRIQLVIVYFVLIALLKSVGVGWVPVVTSIARDFVRRCRALQEPLTRFLDKLCQWFPALQKVRGVLAYAMGVETGEALWHQLVHEADSRIECVFQRS